MWKVIPCNFKKGDLETDSCIKQRLLKPDSDFNMSSYLYYSDIIDKQLKDISNLVDSIIEDNDLDTDNILLILQELESFSQYVDNTIELIYIKSEDNWFVSEDCIAELLKTERKITKRKILEISGKFSLVQ